MQACAGLRIEVGTRFGTLNGMTRRKCLQCNHLRLPAAERGSARGHLSAVPLRRQHGERVGLASQGARISAAEGASPGALPDEFGEAGALSHIPSISRAQIVLPEEMQIGLAICLLTRHPYIESKHGSHRVSVASFVRTLYKKPRRAVCLSFNSDDTRAVSLVIEDQLCANAVDHLAGLELTMVIHEESGSSSARCEQSEA